MRAASFDEAVAAIERDGRTPWIQMDWDYSLGCWTLGVFADDAGIDLRWAGTLVETGLVGPAAEPGRRGEAEVVAIIDQALGGRVGYLGEEDADDGEEER
jgi:hypothetical protein